MCAGQQSRDKRPGAEEFARATKMPGSEQQHRLRTYVRATQLLLLCGVCEQVTSREDPHGCRVPHQRASRQPTRQQQQHLLRHPRKTTTHSHMANTNSPKCATLISSLSNQINSPLTTQKPQQPNPNTSTSVCSLTLTSSHPNPSSPSLTSPANLLT